MVKDYTLTIHGIQSHVVSSSQQLGYTRHGYLKILKRMMAIGYVKQVKRGYYSLTELNIF